jgi:prepilin-type N-terminal cleavage/methylation domain-containing protein
MRRTPGFSLIELLVVIGIMGILLSVGIAAYGKMNDKAKVQEAARLFQTTIRSWQKKADAGVGSEACFGGKFTGIQVERISATLIRASVVCSVPAQNPPQEEFLIPNFVQVDEFGLFVLLPLGKGVEFPEDEDVVFRRITMRNQQNTVTFIVTVTQAGGVDAVKAE